MTINSLIHRRSLTADPAEYEALVEACWYWTERAEDLADDPSDIPGLVADHLADVAAFLRDLANADLVDLAEGEDDDPALVSAKQIAAECDPTEVHEVADALDELATELGH